MTKKPKNKIKVSPFNLNDYTEKSLKESWDIIKDIATNKYGITFYEPHFEIVSFEDMLHIYTGSLPISYDHWSFGKKYEQLYKQYSKDRLSIAYEIIFNTSPAICYLLEHNSPSMQGLVQSHAAIGHSAFFRNNCYFKEFTNAGTIIPFLQQSVEFIHECERKHGYKEVERVLDVCHALELYAIDRSVEKQKTQKQREAQQAKRAEAKDKDYNVNIDTIKVDKLTAIDGGRSRMKEENIVKFIAKHSPSLKPWQREIMQIFCKIHQYLFPQMLTKMMNEGYASFWHYTIMHDLMDEGLLNPSGSLEFLHSHCSVLRQPDFDQPGYGGINPYKLGFEMFKDIKRICTEPTEEDKRWFPGLVGKNWIEEVKFAAYNFKDESFVLQYLSPKVMRDLKLFIVTDDAKEENLEISDIHDDEGYKVLRRKLADSYNFLNRIPDMYIEGWDAKRTRKLYVCFKEKDKVELQLNDVTGTVLELIKSVWGFPVVFKVYKEDGTVDEFTEE